MIKLSSVARLAELNYINTKAAALIDENHAAMKDIYQLCSELKERFDSEENKLQMQVLKSYPLYFLSRQILFWLHLRK